MDLSDSFLFSADGLEKTRSLAEKSEKCVTANFLSAEAKLSFVVDWAEFIQEQQIIQTGYVPIICCQLEH